MTPLVHYDFLKRCFRFNDFCGSLPDLMLQIAKNLLAIEDLDLAKITADYWKFVNENANSNLTTNNYDFLNKKDYLYFCYLLKKRSLSLVPEIESSYLEDDYTQTKAEIMRILQYKKIQNLVDVLRDRKIKSEKHFSKKNCPAPLANFSIASHPNLVVNVSLQKISKVFSDIMAKINYSNQEVVEISAEEVSPIQIERQIKAFLKKTQEQQWKFHLFLLQFSYNLSSLLCCFWVILELIFKGFITAENKHNMIWIKLLNNNVKSV